MQELPGVGNHRPRTRRREDSPGAALVSEWSAQRGTGPGERSAPEVARNMPAKTTGELSKRLVRRDSHSSKQNTAFLSLHNTGKG